MTDYAVHDNADGSAAFIYKEQILEEFTLPYTYLNELVTDWIGPNWNFNKGKWNEAQKRLEWTINE